MSNPDSKSELDQEAALRKLASSGFRVVLEGDEGYDEARGISNSRFGLHPIAIAFPQSAEHVTRRVHFCREHDIEHRIRSEGPQHGDMSIPPG